MRGIMTGTSIMDIELPIGMPMTGYFARKSNSAGIHDQLKIRSIAFDDGSCKLLLVECDLLGLSSTFIKETSAVISSKTGIPPCNIVIACIHTHSGPASIHLQDCGEIDRQWLKRLGPDIAECAVKAVNGLKPSIIEYSTGKCEIGINRIDNENNTTLRDTQFGILVIKDAGSREVDTVIVNYACHPVALPPENLLYSKDYPHYVEKYLKEKFGASVNVIFTTGCCGDINPADRGDFNAAEKTGKKLADCINGASTVTISESDFAHVGLNIDSISVDILLSHDLDENTANKLKENYLDEAKRLADSGKTMEAGVSMAYAKWADSMYNSAKNGTLEQSYNADIKLIRIGKLVIVTFPFEVFHEIGLNIKKHFGFENTFVICYANGDYGYFPAKALYAKASYEAGSAHKFYGHPGPVVMDAEDIVYKALFV